MAGESYKYYLKHWKCPFEKFLSHDWVKYGIDYLLWSKVIKIYFGTRGYQLSA